MSRHVDGLLGGRAFDLAVEPRLVKMKPFSNDRDELLPLRPQHVVQLRALSCMQHHNMVTSSRYFHSKISTVVVAVLLLLLAYYY